MGDPHTKAVDLLEEGERLMNRFEAATNGPDALEEANAGDEWQSWALANAKGLIAVAKAACATERIAGLVMAEVKVAPVLRYSLSSLSKALRYMEEASRG